MAVGSSVLVWAVMFLLYSQGHLDGAALVHVGLAMLCLFALFYGLFRTRLNLRTPEPSLTAAQVLSSIVVIFYAMYHASNTARDVLALIFIMSFFFGVFRLSTRQLVTLAVITVAVYLVMIGMLLRYRPENIDLALELLRCAAVAAVLVWFSTMGGYLSRLRKRLSVNKQRLEKALRTVREMAITDELTGLYNRRYLMDMLERERSLNARTGAPFCVCLADVDHFKDINDTRGHQGGDLVLRAVGDCARPGLRITDYFGRYGGDEFMLILTDTELDTARTAAERLRQQAERLTLRELGPEFRMTLSIGVAQYRPGEDIVQTIRRADAALYQAKQTGRNRAVLADGNARPALSAAKQSVAG